MNSNATLQAVETDLAALSANLVAGTATGGQSLAALEAAVEKLAAIRKDIASLDAQDAPQRIANVRSMAKKVHALLEAAVAFHAKSLFGQMETAGTYAPDGTLNKNHDSRIVFEG